MCVCGGGGEIGGCSITILRTNVHNFESNAQRHESVVLD